MLGGVVAVGLIGRTPTGSSLGDAVALRASASQIGDAAMRLTINPPSSATRLVSQGPPRWITGLPAVRHPVPVPTKRLLGLNWQVDPYQT